jgi:hypothetical protein
LLVLLVLVMQPCLNACVRVCVCVCVSVRARALGR